MEQNLYDNPLGAQGIFILGNQFKAFIQQCQFQFFNLNLLYNNYLSLIVLLYCSYYELNVPDGARERTLEIWMSLF